MATESREQVKRYIKTMGYLRKVHSVYYWKAYYEATSLAQAYNMLRQLDPRVTKPFIPNKATQEKFIETTSAYTLNRTRTNRIVKGKKGYWYA